MTNATSYRVERTSKGFDVIENGECGFFRTSYAGPRALDLARAHAKELRGRGYRSAR